MKRKLLVSILSLPAAVLALSLSACTDEKIVYQEVERKLWEEPPAGAVGYLGYAKEEAKLTICGNCHVGQQATWVSTAHADAWAGLQASGHAAAYCEGCHAVSMLGNSGTIDGGWTTTKDTRYYDVQCESCHGPGQMHVNNPGASQPLAPLDITANNGCGECHADTHHPYMEEWKTSNHGSMPNSASPASRGASCDYCHTGEDALQKWGMTNRYAEKATVLGSTTQHLRITCGVCHDPHSKHEDGQLRFSIEAMDEEENLCMKCHHKRGKPDVTTYRGPHSPEGPVIEGTGGWWPPNMPAVDRIIGTHSSDRNPKLCVGCHMNKFTVNNPDGSFKVNATGHTFNAVPCMAADGTIAESQECEISQKRFNGCATGGCHGSAAAARSAFIVAEDRLEYLAEETEKLVTALVPNWKTCRTNNTCTGNGVAFNTTDGVFTTLEGAVFNAELAKYPGTAAHNPLLVEALLTATMKQIKIEYPAVSVSGIVLDNVLGK